MTTARRLGPHRIELSNLDKVLFPQDGVTKGEVIEHYRTVAPRMLTHVRRRPLTLQRFPDGIGEQGFYQKEMPDYFPGWIPSASVTLADGSRQRQVTADDVSTLVYLAQHAVITLHVWTSRAPRWSLPDRIVFDLDPGERSTFETVRATAEALRDRLADAGLTAFPMLTGSRGVHLWIPIRRGPGLEEVRAFARDVAEALVAERPSDLTTEVRKDAREGRLYLDVARNSKGQTAVAPYSLRARDGAPVATPITWEELRTATSADAFTLRSLPRRLETVGDAWSGMGRHAAELSRARDAWTRRS